MSHTIHNLIQGSPEWHAYRAKNFNASEAAAMLGISSYQSRTELLHAKATGLSPEVDAATQRRFDAGHGFEALARPWAEEIIGEDLYPITASLEVDGLPLSAAYDGATMLEDVVFEHKTLNAGLAESLVLGVIPEQYHPQLEQQLLVIGAERALFMASAGDKDTANCAWYESNPGLRARLIAGWKQFAEDLAAYTPPATAAVPVTAAPIEALPAVQVRMDGALTMHSNLDAFGEALRAFIGKIPAQPTTDQEFADTEAACKALKRAEEALEAEEARALAGMADVEKMRRIVADLAALARTTRLQREKLVKARKDQLRLDQVQRGRAALAGHLQGLNRTLGGEFMPDVPADFAGVIAGKKSLVSIGDAIDTELARAKIAANEAAQRIQANLNTLRQHDEHKHLFPDVAAIVRKAPEDLQALVENRIADEDRRIEAERERIRQEEAARAQEYALATAPPSHQTQIPPETPPASTVVPMPAREPAAATAPSLRLGQITERLGFALTADFLCQLGFEPAGRDRAAVLYHEGDFSLILSALVNHINQVQAKLAA